MQITILLETNHLELYVELNSLNVTPNYGGCTGDARRDERIRQLAVADGARERRSTRQAVHV